MVNRFEELAAWRFCMDLSQKVDELTANVGTPRYREQIQDAAESAPALIAEGFARFTVGEMIRYLRMARAELAEVQSAIRKGVSAKYFSASDAECLTNLAKRAMGTTTNFLKSKLRQSEEEASKKRRQRRSRRKPAR